MNQFRNCICLTNIYKVHGKKEILRDISFRAEPGKVTAFLGPNGAGKSSTLRILLGLDRPTSGSATFGGTPYVQLSSPLKHVGAVFDGIGGLQSRTIQTHLKMIAQSNDIPLQRIPEVLDLVDLKDFKKARLGTLSLGEGQRLGLAVALLGNPQYLVLDEPMNCLDPAGIRWLRKFICSQAQDGKTVLLSSHLLSEVEEITDDVVIIHLGKIVAQGALDKVMQNLTSLEEVFFLLTES